MIAFIGQSSRHLSLAFCVRVGSTASSYDFVEGGSLTGRLYPAAFARSAEKSEHCLFPSALLPWYFSTPSAARVSAVASTLLSARTTPTTLAPSAAEHAPGLPFTC